VQPRIQGPTDTWFDSSLVELWESKDAWLVAWASNERVLSLGGPRFRSYAM